MTLLIRSLTPQEIQLAAVFVPSLYVVYIFVFVYVYIRSKLLNIHCRQLQNFPSRLQKSVMKENIECEYYHDQLI